ncbi:unnamed protein product, partial [Rotaria sp. Silwood1]
MDYLLLSKWCSRIVAWASIQRYILIFHHGWMSTQKKKILLHYIPITTIIIYGIILYMTIDLFLSCDRSYYSTILYCGFSSCAYNSTAYSIFELITGGITNIKIIAICSMILIIRLIKQKHRLNQQLNWRKHRKMAIQLLSIILLFYIFYLPKTQKMGNQPMKTIMEPPTFGVCQINNRGMAAEMRQKDDNQKKATNTPLLDVEDRRKLNKVVHCENF